MRNLTNKEEQIMELYWDKGPMFIHELQALYDEPRPHFNTLSTQVRTLEKDGFIAHRTLGGSYQYFAAITREEYGKGGIEGMVKTYLGNSYRDLVSAFVQDEHLSLGELKELVATIEAAEGMETL
jgi:predicted transcriptional regulator